MRAFGEQYREAVASSYFAVRWRHDSPHDPVLLFEELNEQRPETRKSRSTPTAAGSGLTALRRN